MAGCNGPPSRPLSGEAWGSIPISAEWLRVVCGMSSDAFPHLYLLMEHPVLVLNVSNVLQYLPVASAFLVTGVTLTTLSIREGIVMTSNCTSSSILVSFFYLR